MRQHTDFYLLRSPLIAAVTIQSSPSNFERLGDPWDTPMVLLELCSLTQRLTQENVALFSKKDPILVWLLTCLAKSAEVEFPREHMSFGPISTSQYNQYRHVDPSGDKQRLSEAPKLRG